MRTQLAAAALVLSTSSLCHALPGHAPLRTPPTVIHPYWVEGPYSLNRTVYGSATSFPLPTAPSEEPCETATSTPPPAQEPCEANTTTSLIPLPPPSSYQQPSLSYSSIVYQPSTVIPEYPTPSTWTSEYPVPCNSTTLVTPLSSSTYPVLGSPSPSSYNTTDIPPAFTTQPSTASSSQLPSLATSVSVSSSIIVPTFTLENSVTTTTATTTTISTATVITARPETSSTGPVASTSTVSESSSAESSTIDSSFVSSTSSESASNAEPASPTAVGTTEQFTLTQTATPTPSSSSTAEQTGAPPAPPFVGGGMGKERVWWVSFVIPLLLMV